MSLFHTHNWEVVSTDYTAPRGVKVNNASEEVFQQLFSGVTHIYQKCSSCGDIQQKDVIGKYQP